MKSFIPLCVECNVHYLFKVTFASASGRMSKHETFHLHYKDRKFWCPCYFTDYTFQLSDFM